MKFNLNLDDKMCLSTKDDFVVRQGTHNMDTIVIHRGGQYQGMSGYLEFDLPRERKHVSHVLNGNDILEYFIPSAVTLNDGLASVQVVLSNDTTIIKSNTLSFEILPSINADKHYDEQEKHDLFANIKDELVKSQQQTDKCLVATNNAETSAREINTLKKDIEGKLSRGEFDGADGKDGKDGTTPSITISNTTGCWEVDGKSTGVKAQGPKGEDGKVDESYLKRDGTSAEANRFRFNQMLDPTKYYIKSPSYGMTYSTNGEKISVKGVYNATSTCFVTLAGVNLIKGNVYYIDFLFADNLSSANPDIISLKASGPQQINAGGGPTIFTAIDEHPKYEIYFSTNELNKQYDITLRPIVIDLTKMFGKGKEPKTIAEVYRYIVKGTYYPYYDVPTKQEGNENWGMVPSDTVDDNIMPNIGMETENTYVAPANGIIYVFIKSKGNVVAPVLYVNGVKLYEQNIDLGWGATFSAILKKGDRVKFTASYGYVNKDLSFSKFVYAKEMA